MHKEEILKRAEKFFENDDLDLVKPGKFGYEEDGRVEVIFLLKDALDPNISIDPPDVRVWVYTKSGEVEFIPQI